jgi:CYTH domain-containing protein
MNNPSKHARIERERRFLLPEFPNDIDQSQFRSIDDLYITNTRLRLRRVTDSDYGTIDFKLTQKIPIDGARAQVTTVYLTEEEYEVLAMLPGRRLTKRRYRHSWGTTRYGVDAFAGPLHGLVLCEAEVGTDAALDLLAAPTVGCVEVTDALAFRGATLANAAPEATLESARRLIAGR